MPTQLPPDRILAEKALRTSIKQRITDGVQGFQMGVLIYEVERFPESDKEDLSLSTVADPLTGVDSTGRPRQPRTSIIEIGIPTFNEKAHTSDAGTVLTLTYPITFNMDAVDFWDKPELQFKNSSDLIIAMCMKISKEFKDHIDLGYLNVVHEYLQQVSAVSPRDPESGGKWHTIDWSLTVNVTSCVF